MGQIWESLEKWGEETKDMDSLLVSLPVAMIKKIPDKSYLREQGFTFTLGSQFSVTAHHRGELSGRSLSDMTSNPQ